MDGLCEHLRNSPNVIIAQKQDAEQKKPSLASCLQCWPLWSLIPLSSILTTVRRTCVGMGMSVAPELGFPMVYAGLECVLDKCPVFIGPVFTLTASFLCPHLALCSMVL